ncbi:MAG: right-handed parallel beta-helix repeat-containing protein [Candidatus Thorarchaeota archaeon]
MFTSGLSVVTGKRYACLSFLFLLVVLSLPLSISYSPSAPLLVVVDSLPAQRIDHGPILIRNNSDFLEQKSTYGWSGNGTEDFPIVISDYRIEDYQVGIDIENIDLYFIIRNCEINDFEYLNQSTYGIRMKNCTHGTIDAAYTNMKETGVLIEDSDNITISHSIIHDCQTAVSIFNTSNIFIETNHFGWNDYTGIVLNQTERCWILDTFLLGLPDYGILCVRDNCTTIADNVITSGAQGDSQFSHYGISSLSSWNLVIEAVDISFCYVGVDLFDTKDSYVGYCNFTGNSYYGIFLHPETYNMTIRENHFGPNGLNAHDDGQNNYWDSNFWSDYIGEGYYYIPGSAESVDLNPRIFSQPTTTSTSPTSNHETDDINYRFRLILSFGIGLEIVLVTYLLYRRKRIR